MAGEGGGCRKMKGTKGPLGPLAAATGVCWVRPVHLVAGEDKLVHTVM